MRWDDALLAPEERVLSTLEKDGSRRWLYPRLARGRFWRARLLVAWGLIAVFAALPYMKINGKPAILLDIVHRKFHLFGQTFLPTDTILLALLLVGLVLGVFLVSALLGRIWCGWACPQTVYLEFVFRPIERLFSGRRGVGGKPPQDLAAWRRALMYVAFFAVSFYLAHTFLAYWVGVENLRRWIFGSPMEHPVAFATVAVVTFLMLFDFVYFREQTCIIACPYGRLQSVLLDRNSLIIGYDRARGEPRGKRVSLPQAPARGDCIDCNLCVAVCPTGIDIREGLQIECVGCAQCIDACDAVMDKVGTPRGLIRYGSQQGMAGGRAKIHRPRVLVYAGALSLVAGLFVWLLATKSPMDLSVQRNAGAPFMVNDGLVENTVRIRIANRTDRPESYRICVVGADGVRVVQGVTPGAIRIEAGEQHIEPVKLIVPPATFRAGVAEVRVRVESGDGHAAERPLRLLGPVGGGGP